jgi:hypothetical protein
MPTIHTRRERERGCGYRKKGGMYFVSEGVAAPCDKLPIPLTVCPCCNHGIKQTRGYQWINSQLFSAAICSGQCTTCPMNFKNLRMGLMWVGEKFYSTAGEFIKEANAMGVSKRISQVPRDFVVGETWIALAHPKACNGIGEGGKQVMVPGVFRAFKPSAIEYVIKGNETDEELVDLEARGFTLVNVIPDKDSQTTMYEDDEE